MKLVTLHINRPDCIEEKTGNKITKIFLVFASIICNSYQ